MYLKTAGQGANWGTWIKKPSFKFLSTDCFTKVMRKILVVLVLLRNWKFTLVDNAGPTVTKAAVIIKSDQFANTKRTQFLEYRKTITL